MPRTSNRPLSLLAAPLAVLAPTLLVSPLAHAQAQAPAYQAPPPASAPGVQPQAAPEQPPPPAGYPPADPNYPPPQPGYPPPAGYAQPGYAPPPGYQAQPGYPPPQQGYPPPAGYPAPPPYASMRAPGAETHDGFFLRLHLGGGYTSMSASADGNKVELSGGSLGLGVALGGSVSPNLIIYGAVVSASIQDPDYTVNGTTETLTNISANLTGLGVGAAYYLTPSNVYVSGTLLATWLSLRDSNDDTSDPYDQTKVGGGLEVLVGKEWWVSDNWGLGASAQLLLAAMQAKGAFVTGGSVPTWTSASFSLLFSATYN